MNQHYFIKKNFEFLKSHRFKILVSLLLVLCSTLYSENLRDQRTIRSIPNLINKRIQANPFHQGSNPIESKFIPKQNKFSQWLSKTQRKIQKKLKKYVESIKNGSKKAIILSFLVSFIYGAIHAAGPGHRKIIFFTYFSSNKHKVSTLFASGFASAGIHALSAVTLTSIIFFTVKKAASSKLGEVSRITELATWLFIALFGLIMLITQMIKIFSTKNESTKKIIKKERALPILIIFSSIVPCPAASMIFIVTLHQQIAAVGILLIIAMSLGMGITISLSSLIALLASNGIRKIAKKKTEKKSLIETILESLGSIVMILIGLLMSYPIILTLLFK